MCTKYAVFTAMVDATPNTAITNYGQCQSCCECVNVSLTKISMHIAQNEIEDKNYSKNDFWTLSCAFDVINDYHLNIEKRGGKIEREKINKTP